MLSLKKQLLLLLAVLFACALNSPLRAQNPPPTVLAAGDIIFTGYNSIPSPATNADVIAFVLLKDISAGTKISFTDRGYWGSSWGPVNSTEGTIRWTAGTALSVGAQVIITGLTSKLYNPGNNTLTVNGAVEKTEFFPNSLNDNNAGLSLSAPSGDQIIAFQSAGIDVSASSGVTLIAGLHFSMCNATTTDATWDGPTCFDGSSKSTMPPGLVAGFSAFRAVPPSSNSAYSGRFNNCSGGPFTTASQIRNAVMDRSNWIFDNAGTGVVIPSSCDLSVPTAPTNAAPVISSLGGTTAFTEGTAVTIANALTVTDADNTTLTEAKVSITTNFQSLEDRLIFINQNGITGSYDTGTGVLTLTGTASIANYQVALRSIQYNNISSSPSTASRTISFTVKDGTANSTAATKAVSVTAVNNNPTVSGLPASLTFTEDATTSVLDLSGIAISDPDIGTGNITVVLKASAGIFDIAGGTGVTPSGHLTSELTLTGKLSDINTYLNIPTNIYYIPAANANGSNAATITFTANDNGNTGLGGGTTVPLGTISINVTPVNDAPVAVDDDVAVVRNTPKSGNVLTNDTDVEGNVLTSSLVTAPVNGTVVLNADGSFTYTPNANFVGTDTFDYQVCDNGVPSLCDTGRVNLTISAPLNTAPVFANLNGDSVAWPGVGNTVMLDASANATISDADFNALNSGNGNYAGAMLTVRRAGNAISSDNLGFNTAGASFNVSGNNLQSAGQTFATYTNTGGVLTITFTSSGTAATTALVTGVLKSITYRNDTPAGDATVRFTFSDGTASTTADVTVTSDQIYVNNATDTETIDLSNGVSLSEAVAIAASDATGSQQIIFAANLAGQTITTNALLEINESLTFNNDAAAGLTINGDFIRLNNGATLIWAGNSSATLANGIYGTGALTKAGAGNLTLSGSNNFTGATTVNAGTLTASGGNAIFDTSDVTVSSGATLALSANETIRNLSGAGTINLGSSTLTTVITASTTFSGNINGTGGLAVTQAGAANFALTLSGSNTYTGMTNTTGYAWLKLNGDAAVPNNGTLRLSSNSKVDLLTDQTVGTLQTSVGTILNLDAYQLTSASAANNNDVLGIIAGTGNLVKQGTGTMTLAGTNTYSGTTTVEGGTLSITSDSNLGAGAITLANGTTLRVTGAATIDNAVNVDGNVIINIGLETTLSGNLNIQTGATLTKGESGHLRLTGTTVQNDANLLLDNGTFEIQAPGNLPKGSISIQNSAYLNANQNMTIPNQIILSNGIGVISTTADVVLNGAISGPGHLSKVQTGSLTLNGTNSSSGTLSLQEGTLNIAKDENLPTGTIYMSGSPTLNINSTATIDNSLTLSSGDATINIPASYNVAWSGVISGTGNLYKDGAGTLGLLGTNTYTGTTYLNNGTLNVTGSINSNVSNGARLTGTGSITGNVYSNSAATLAPGVNGSGTLTINGDLTLDLNGNFEVHINSATDYTKVKLNGGGTLRSALSVLGAYQPAEGDLFTFIDNDGTDAFSYTFANLFEGGNKTVNTVNLKASYVGGTGNDFVLSSPDITSPSIASVSVPSNGTYKIGDNLNFTINFDENVTVTGTPRITLTVGTTTVYANYLSGSGTAALVFRATVSPGDIDTDGITIGILGLNGGTIRDEAANNAVLTLNSVGSTAAVLVDGIVPTVVAVSSSTANGAYRPGDVISIQVNFSEVVNVTGLPQLALETGALDRIINYSSGSGTSSLTFDYTILAGDNSADLDYTSTTALALNGGTIKDIAGNNATLTLAAPGAAGSLAANKAIVVDSKAPTLAITSSVNSLKISETATITFTFSEPVNGTFTWDGSNGDVVVSGGTLSAISGSGLAYTATFTPTPGVNNGTASITVAAGSYTDVAGNNGEAGSTPSLTFDTKAPVTPTDFVATKGNTQNVLTWTANSESDLASYKVYGGTSTNPTTLLGTVIKPTATYTHTGLNNGTKYYYRIVAVDAVGNESAASAVLSATPQGTQNITFNALAVRTYGDADFNPGATASSGLEVGYTSDNTAVATIVDGKIHIVGAGTATITAIQAGNETYLAATAVPQTLMVTKRSIAITANAKNKVYGQPDPAFDYQLTSGSLVSGDNFSGTLNRAGNENVGTYAINQGSLVINDSYTISFIGANLVIEKAVLTLTANNAVMCQGNSLPSFGVNYNGFKFSDSEYSLSTRPVVSTTATSNSQAGNYTLSPGGAVANNYSFAYVNGSLTINALPVVTIRSDKGTSLSKGETMVLSASSNNGTSYSWSNAAGIISGNQSAELTVRPLVTTTYTVTVTSASGCTTTASFTVEVNEDFLALKAENFITPNGDGKNDTWVVHNIDVYPNHSLTIVDRAGKIVYEARNYKNDWDGTFKGSPLQQGTYYYIFRFENKNVGPKKGFITIVRPEQ